MEMGERVAERGAMLDIGAPHPQAFEEGDERRGPPGQFLQRAAARSLTGSGQEIPRAARCCISARK